jgi:5'(3')-deoxyribonucleotidase
MDGTLADFDGAGGVEKMNEKGFFENLLPYPKAIETLAAISEISTEIFILSACIPTEFCKTEKLTWLKKYLPFIKDENIVLIKVGQNKASEFIRATNTTIDEGDYLFDDYGKNLKDWYEAGGTPIKCGKAYKPERPYKQLIQFQNIRKVFA